MLEQSHKSSISDSGDHLASLTVRAELQNFITIDSWTVIPLGRTEQFTHGFESICTATISARLLFVANPDKSNGYEGIAPMYMARRGQSLSGIGTSVVADWSLTLPEGASVLDLGCGTGLPMAHIFIERGFNVYGVDASASMIAAFRARFPTVPLQCAAVEDSDFFGRSFDGVFAWGLFFLLNAEIQLHLIAKISAVMPSGGKFLFTAPRESCAWADVMTEQTSVSLGQQAYQNALENEGFSLVATMTDEGDNYYYSAQKL